MFCGELVLTSLWPRLSHSSRFKHLLGGMPVSVRLRDCEVLQKITRSQAEERRLYGAICAAPAVTLLPWGLLRRKQTTSHPAFFDKLPTFWAVKSNIQVSGALTTSRGPGTCFVFALCLVEQLYGETVAKELGELLEVSFPYFWQDPYRELKLVGPADDESRKEEFNNVEWSFDRIPRVLILVANGSEEIEVVTIVDILRQAKVDITVASVEKSVQILASQGTNIIADKLLGVAADSTYDLIILPGGDAGTERLSKSRILKRLLKEQGLLKGKKATAHPSMANKPTNVLVNNTRVVIDGKLITSRGLATVAEFALAIVSKLYGHARARSDDHIVIDGKLITSRGLATVAEFALAIVSKLYGHARARSVAEGLVYEYPRTWAEKVLACNILSVLIHDKYIWSAKLTLPLEKVHIIWLGNWLHKRADSSSIVIAENYMPIDVYSSAISQQLNISVAKVTLPLVYVKEGTVEMEMPIGFVAEF